MSRKIGALWLRKSKDNKTYMSGIIEDLAGDIQIVVFRNDKKEKENQPDFSILLSKKEDRKPVEADPFGNFDQDSKPVKVDTGEIPVIQDPIFKQENEQDSIDVKDIPF